ncbi:hypothetical protein MJM95_32080, partial [Salmonella enterica subsp. enterica serovar Anatum]|nr:hypothetical protein [Salmonella enterica subsp. enterica serovar Anatum]
ELKANPAKGVSAPKAPRHLPKNIDVDDVNRLLDIDLNDPLAVTSSSKFSMRVWPFSPFSCSYMVRRPESLITRSVCTCSGMS